MTLDTSKIAAARQYFMEKFPFCRVLDAFLPDYNMHVLRILVSPTAWYEIDIAPAFLEPLSPTDIQRELEERHIAEAVAKPDVASVTVNRADVVITLKEC